MTTTILDICEQVVTCCCHKLSDIECITTCELTGAILCDEHIVFIDKDFLNLRIVCPLSDSELKGKDFILTSKFIAELINHEICDAFNVG